MAYSDADAAFDDEVLHGPRCPRHGRNACACCRGCGRENGYHNPRCDDFDPDEGPDPSDGYHAARDAELDDA